MAKNNNPKPALRGTDSTVLQSAAKDLRDMSVAVSVLAQDPSPEVAQVIEEHIMRDDTGLYFRFSSVSGDDFINVLDRAKDGAF